MLRVKPEKNVGLTQEQVEQLRAFAAKVHA
jgi:hypothetical protein